MTKGKECSFLPFWGKESRSEGNKRERGGKHSLSFPTKDPERRKKKKKGGEGGSRYLTLSSFLSFFFYKKKKKSGEGEEGGGEFVYYLIYFSLFYSSEIRGGRGKIRKGGRNPFLSPLSLSPRGRGRRKERGKEKESR